ncbi:MATE family efflux transporter [Belliella kenyensis]|uniref:MATE family efflux transporter n=1 Tax=Belliella kenyensis TaxID=1472724 RepID=A0ABV8EJ81_9BACT|nr:MATE family efflux transporter [Belliella kenyensis]MCH7402646.1 MATE family efflux transporter [Belliella kenyensis]MDN3603806.1 MATE family efflux transporter [Belliella kenyensis]
MIEKISLSYRNILGYINSGQARSIKAKKNILGTLLIKGLSIGISLLMVPMTLNYVSPTKYGIWLTISSIVGWFSFFDIGLTQGLRNKLAESLAIGDDKLAKTYVSTTYASLIIIFSLVWVVFMIANNFIDWPGILNTDTAIVGDLSKLMIIVFTYFCMQFILKTISSILTADQKPAIASFIDVLGQVVVLLVIIVLIRTTEGSLFNLGLALCISPLVVLVVANFILFNGRYSKLKPTVASVDFGYARNLFQLGGTFFIIQVAAVIQYQSANFIIVRNFLAEDVVAYNIAYKFFGILNMVFAIFLTPFWSASTEAFMKKDFAWIKSSIKKYNLLIIAFIGVGLVMVLVSDYIYKLWLGDELVNIPKSLSVWAYIFFICYMFGNTYVSFLNGISALRLQFWASLISPVVYILIAIYLIQVLGLGVHALFIAAVIANLNGVLLAPFQYFMIVIKKKRGVWIK